MAFRSNERGPGHRSGLWARFRGRSKGKKRFAFPGEELDKIRMT